ncbi:MAG: hypothetical protein N2111_09580 [Candidatus Sumerlaeaceae bacterium]|nr:hypothetical protein [Candidatus Sumerlaeaceae bacterium]
MDEAVVGSGTDAALRAHERTHACVFLCDDKKCELHRVFGPMAKPSVCLEFPYRYRETPGGIYVGLSFACPSVRGNRGQPVADQRAELADGLVRSFSLRKVADPVRLSSWHELDWPSYLELENALDERLGRSAEPINRRLIEASLVLRFFRLFDHARHGPRAPDEWTRRVPREELEEFLTALRRTDFVEIQRLASKPCRSLLLKRMFMGSVAGFASALWRSAGRVGTVWTIACQYARHASGLGRVRLAPVDATVSHRELAEMRLPAPGSESAILIERYLRHCLFRKDLLDAPTVERGLNMLLLNAALIPWYALAVARAHNRSEPSAADWSDAVGEVEKTYGFHSKFYALMAAQPVIEQVVESFTSRPDYPFLVLGDFAGAASGT